ncbi:uncharacterized protein EAF01_011316 [Botrytis porri]|uniref:uncharacterized protein n=1 Tax=Botrytis porri TaxID=87229 RepID=UPI001900D6E5|nr:uncharacterized protein EAF01_011316 [Botrytis porri]KAF7886638.1 hypothetical protein EAF01_011316 [Botrytis porri]
MAKSFEGAELATFNTKELTPNLVDAISATEPEAIFAEYPVASRKTGPGEDFPALAYIGPNDIVAIAFLLGAVKPGCKALLISPRNSIRAPENLPTFTKCKTLVTTSPRSTQLQPMIAALSSMAL